MLKRWLPKLATYVRLKWQYQTSKQTNKKHIKKKPEVGEWRGKVQVLNTRLIVHYITLSNPVCVSLSLSPSLPPSPSLSSLSLSPLPPSLHLSSHHSLSLPLPFTARSAIQTTAFHENKQTKIKIFQGIKVAQRRQTWRGWSYEFSESDCYSEWQVWFGEQIQKDDQIWKCAWRSVGPRSTWRLSPPIRSVASGNQWRGPVKSRILGFNWSAPLVSCSNWSDRRTESDSGLGPYFLQLCDIWSQ